MRRTRIVIPQAVNEHTMWVTAAICATHEVVEVRVDGDTELHKYFPFCQTIRTQDVNIRELFMTEGLLFLLHSTRKDVQLLVDRVHHSFEHDGPSWFRLHYHNSDVAPLLFGDRQLLMMFKRDPMSVGRMLGYSLRELTETHYMKEELRVWLSGHCGCSTTCVSGEEMNVVVCTTWPENCHMTMEERFELLQHEVLNHRIALPNKKQNTMLIVGEESMSGPPRAHLRYLTTSSIVRPAIPVKSFDEGTCLRWLKQATAFSFLTEETVAA